MSRELKDWRVSLRWWDERQGCPVGAETRIRAFSPTNAIKGAMRVWSVKEQEVTRVNVEVC